MPEFVDPDRGEVRGVVEPREELPLGDERPQVDDAFVAVVECDLQNAMDDGLRINDAGQLFHLIGSTFSCAVAAAKRSSKTSFRNAAQDRTLPRLAPATIQP